MGVVPYWGRQPAAYLAGLYGVHCMSWVVELDPRVLRDKCGMSFTASANGLSSVTSYGLRVLVSTSVTFLFWLCFDFGFGFGLGITSTSLG